MRTNQSKHLLFGIIVLMLFSFKSYGQDSWTLLKEESNVQVFYMSVACIGMTNVDPLDTHTGHDSHETFKLKIINNNSTDVPISLTFSKITKGSYTPLQFLINIGTSNLCIRAFYTLQ